MKKLALALALVGCAPVYEVDPAAIVGGTVDSGDPAIYYLSTTAGACTGTLVSPHVVLTARHCIVDHTNDMILDPSVVSVYVGQGPSFDHTYHAASLAVVPGSNEFAIDAGAPDDLGLIVLDTAAMETPLVMDRGSPADLVGGSLVAVGFGQTPEGTLGVKRTVTTSVDRYADGMFWTPPAVCPGDSGGPGIGPNGHVWGVAVLFFTPDGGPLVCGTSIGGYNAIDLHMDWIESVIQGAGDGCFPHPEVCDGVDNDCNGTVDDDCRADGAACTDASQCTSLRCEDTAAGRICTRACDASRGSAACTGGLRCVRTEDCSGLCVPPSAAGLALDAACMMDAECSSGSCVDPGDGRRRCAVACHGDAGQCASGEVCAAQDGACGACVAAAIFGSAHGLGEECSSDTDCRSQHCAIRAGLGECATPCDGGACPDGFVCQGALCVLDREQPAGGACEVASDCALGQCLAQGDRGWCSGDCSTMPCPHGFTCTDLGGASACVPSLALTGERCGADADCALGTCMAGACSVPCAQPSDCGPGLRCVRDGLAGSCRPPSEPSVSHGCAVSAHGEPGLSGLVLLAASVWLLRRARRR